MSKPTESMIEEWFSIASSQPALKYWIDLEPLLRPIEPTDVNHKTLTHIRSSLELAEVAYSSLNNDLRETAANRWAHSQPGFVRAATYLRKKNRAESSSDGAAWIESVLASIVSPDHVHATWSSLKRKFEWSPKNNWFGGLLRALHEILYTNNAEQLFALSRDAPKALSKLSDAITDALPLWERYNKEKGIRSIAVLERLLRDIQRMRFADLPIQRNTQHKAEHLFVYRLWLNNMQVYRRPKADAIAELMTVEGVPHQFDERTVERMCARFKAAKLAAFHAKLAVANKPG